MKIMDKNSDPIFNGGKVRSSTHKLFLQVAGR